MLGDDLSSECDILRVSLKENLASTAEHTAALHERFAKPAPCKDWTKLLLEMRLWPADLKELQAAVQETVVQSLVTVASSIRAMSKGAKSEGIGVYGASVPCRQTFCQKNSADKCRFSHRESGAKSKNVGNEKDRCKKCGKNESLGQVKFEGSLGASRTDARFIVNIETLPPGLPSPAPQQPDANGANSENATALAVILKLANPKDLLNLARQHDLRRLPGQQDMWFGTR